MPEDAPHGLVPHLRKFLRERLPHYMIPSSFVVLDELPMTRNGKVDHGALIAMAQKRPDLEQAYVPPRNETEATLAGIWSELLGIERVGIHDNFFELGGDSILTIQIIARANQAGLRLRPAQLFQYQTIAEVAAMVGLAPAIQAEQGVLTGAVPLTPIQHWFFEQNFNDPYHYNQSVLMEAPRSVDAAKLSMVLDRLLLHHDALRLRFATDGARMAANVCGRRGDVPGVPRPVHVAACGARGRLRERSRGIAGWFEPGRRATFAGCVD